MGQNVKDRLLIGIGWLCVALGFVGAFVPLMPTTTFLLIAAWCFWRADRRLHAWLLDHPVLGHYIRDFLEGRGMPIKAKVLSLTAMWLSIGSGIVFIVPNIFGDVFLLACGLVGTVVVARQPTRQAV